VVCTVGTAAEANAEAGIGLVCPNKYRSGTFSSQDTFADSTDPTNEPTIQAGNEIDPAWSDCATLQSVLLELRTVSGADVCVGNSCPVPSTTPTSVTFIDGDLTVGAGISGYGLLVVTGTLSFHATSTWSGAVAVIGEGSFIRSGAGAGGTFTGGTVVANIAGPDGIYGNGDDCTGGTAGFATATYHEANQQWGDTTYCTDDLIAASPLTTYDIVHFRQE